MPRTFVAVVLSALVATVASFAIAYAQRPAPTARASSDPVVAQLQAINRNISALRRENRAGLLLINKSLGTFSFGGVSTNVLSGLYSICNLLTDSPTIYC